SGLVRASLRLEPGEPQDIADWLAQWRTIKQRVLVCLRCHLLSLDHCGSLAIGNHAAAATSASRESSAQLGRRCQPYGGRVAEGCPIACRTMVVPRLEPEVVGRARCEPVD